jgi:DNA-binding transcriptional ArsR family regulator
MEDIKILTTLEEVKAISDPLKYKILMTFYKLEQPATVKQIADDLKDVPSKVHYHVKKMEQAGVLKLVYTKEIKGIIAKFYEPTAKDFEIKCVGEASEGNKKIMLAESQQMIADFYELSKNTFLDELTYVAQNEEKTDGIVSMQDLYLTPEDVAEFSKYKSDFYEKHKNKDRNAYNAHKHHCFISLIKINNEK